MATPERKHSAQVSLNLEPQASGINFPELESVGRLRQRFEKVIWQNIQIMEEIYFNKMPQKCLVHNNNFTLYCENDMRPLCASCVYQNLGHKNHRIMPLGSSVELLEIDCSNSEKELTSTIDLLNGLVKDINFGIVKMEREYPEIVKKIELAFQELQEGLQRKQKECIDLLRFNRDKIKYQNATLSAELNQIAIFVDEKVEKYKKRIDEDILLTKRCVYETLKNVSKIVGGELILEEDSEPKLNFEIFEEIEEFLNSKFPKLFTKQNNKLTRSIHGNSSKKMLTVSRDKKGSLSPNSLKKNIHENFNQRNMSSNGKRSQMLAHKDTKKISPSPSPQKGKNKIPKSPSKAPKSIEKEKATHVNVALMRDIDATKCVSYHSPVIKVTGWKV